MVVTVYSGGVNSDRVRNVITYCRVSTDEQAVSGLGIEAQRAAIERELNAREWSEVFAVVDAGVSGTVAPMERPQLAEALAMLEAGEADALVVAKLDRATRSIGDLVQLMERADNEGWDFVALDLGVDTATSMGRAMASVAGAFAQLERDLISERTRAALAVKKAQGVRLGRPSEQSAENLDRVAELTREGLGVRKIADRMNEEGRTTGRGGKWHPTTVHRAQRERPDARWQAA